MDNPPAAYQPYLETLIAFATAEPRKADLLAAKADYFEHTGEIFEDDKQFEMRMASFLDWYLFDRRSPQTGRTPAQELYEDKQKTAPQDLVVAFRTFTETVHGLFEVRKVGRARFGCGRSPPARTTKSPSGDRRQGWRRATSWRRG
jgi:hypothetical protein